MMKNPSSSEPSRFLFNERRLLAKNKPMVKGTIKYCMVGRVSEASASNIPADKKRL